MFKIQTTMRKLLILATLIANFLSAYAQNVNIPDANFKAALINNASINTDGNTEISTAEAIAFTGSIIVTSQNINDLTGIEAFPNITRLEAIDNNLTSIDLTANTQLLALLLRENDLVELNTSQLTQLVTLDASVNDLTSVTLPASSSLTSISLRSNAITSLDLTDQSAIEILRLSENDFSTINLSQNFSLRELDLRSNIIETVDVSANTELRLLNLQNNFLSAVNLDNNRHIENLDVSNNPGLAGFNTAELSNLSIFRANRTGSTMIDLSKNTNLTLVQASDNNSLTSFNISNGNNTAISNTNFRVINNSNLSCIQVSNQEYAQNNWLNVDEGVLFSTNCDGSPMTITPQTVSTNAPASVCLDDDQSYAVTIAGSQTGVEYFLTDADQGTVLDGPVAGSGSPIDFNTGNLNRNTTFEVIGQITDGRESALAMRQDGDEATAATGWDFDYSQGYTLEFVFNGSSNPNGFQNALFSIGNENISDLEVYFQNQTNLLVVFHNRGLGSGRFNRYTSPAPDRTVHIAIVYDVATGLKVYYDGVEQNVAFTSDPLISAQSMQRSNNVTWKIGTIAHSAFGDTENVEGIFDEVRVWNISRTQAAIETFRNSCVEANSQHLIHYYPMNNMGNVIEDATGALDLNIANLDNSNNREPALVSCTDPDPAVLFDGDNDFASATASWDFDYSLGYTLEFNFSGNTNPSDFQNALFSIGEAAISDLEVYFQQTTGFLTVVHNRGTSGFRFNRYLAPLPNRHTHIAIVYDPAVGLSVYYNGIAQNIVFANDDPTINANSLRKTAGDLTWKLGEIAHQDFGNTSNSEGIFDEVRVWSTIRSQDEINSYRHGCVDQTSVGLSHYYQLNEGNGSVINDAVGDLQLNFSNTNAGSNWINALISCLGSSSQRISMANNVTIGDLSKPQIALLPVLQLTLNASGNATLDLADLVTAASDNCTDSTALAFSVDRTQFNCADFGTNTVEITVTDEAGNESFESTQVTVVDDLTPTVFADDLTISTDAGKCEAANIQYTQNLGFTDNCENGVSTIFSTPEGSTLAVGNHTVTYTVTDQSGNTTSVDFMVAVVDQEAPQIVSCLNDTIVIADRSNDYIVPDFSQLSNLEINDNCGSVSISQSVPIGSTLNVGVHDVQLSFTDDAGNISTCDFTITVNQVLNSADSPLNNSISIYPNPATDYLTIDSQGRIHQIRILTLAGHLMVQTTDKIVDLTSFQSGIYLLQIETDRGTVVQKIIKE